MTVDALLQHLIEIDASLIPQAEGGLAVEATGAMLTDEVIDAVREHKREIWKRMAIAERRRNETDRNAIQSVAKGEGVPNA